VGEPLSRDRESNLNPLSEWTSVEMEDEAVVKLEELVVTLNTQLAHLKTRRASSEEDRRPILVRTVSLASSFINKGLGSARLSFS